MEQTNKTKYKSYYIMTKGGKKRFKRWLINNDLTADEFAIRCGCSSAYISAVINGKKHITRKTRALFDRGGYEFI